MTASQKSDVHIREATFADYEQIVALEARHGLGHRSAEEWLHLWRNNPAYARQPDWCIGWVIETADKGLVGTLGNVPLAYEFKGRHLVAAAGRGMAVDEEYRGHAVYLIRRFVHQKKPDLWLDTSANPNSSRFHELMRWKRVPSGAWDQSVFWITNYRGFTKSLLLTKGVPNSVSGILSTPLLLEHAFRRKGVSTHRNGHSNHLRVIPEFDARFDQFWDELKNSRPNQLLADHSSASLEWHFRYPLANKRVFILGVEEGSRLLAYAVFMRQDNQAVQLQRMRMVDFQALPERAEWMKPMLSLALDMCRGQGIHMLEAYGFGNEKEQLLKSLASHRRQFAAWPCFYKAPAPLMKELSDPGVWDTSCFDGDASL